jgi:hypothetical protein
LQAASINEMRECWSWVVWIALNTTIIMVGHLRNWATWNQTVSASWTCE